MRRAGSLEKIAWRSILPGTVFAPMAKPFQQAHSFSTRDGESSRQEIVWLIFHARFCSFGSRWVRLRPPRPYPPLRIRPAVIDQIGANVDLMSTIASVTGAPLPADRRYDSIDLSPTLADDAPQPFIAGNK